MTATVNYSNVESAPWGIIYTFVNNRSYVPDPRGQANRIFVHDSDPLQKSFEFSGLPYIILDLPTVEFGEQSPDANEAIVKWKLKLTVRTAKDGSAGTRTDTGRSDMFTITDSLHKTFQDLTVKQSWRDSHLYSVNLQHVSSDTNVVDQRIMFENVFEINGSTRMRTNP